MSDAKQSPISAWTKHFSGPQNGCLVALATHGLIERFMLVVKDCNWEVFAQDNQLNPPVASGQVPKHFQSVALCERRACAAAEQWVNDMIDKNAALADTPDDFEISGWSDWTSGEASGKTAITKFFVLRAEDTGHWFVFEGGITGSVVSAGHVPSVMFEGLPQRCTQNVTRARAEAEKAAREHTTNRLLSREKEKAGPEFSMSGWLRCHTGTPTEHAYAATEHFQLQAYATGSWLIFNKADRVVAPPVAEGRVPVIAFETAAMTEDRAKAAAELAARGLTAKLTSKPTIGDVTASVDPIFNAMPKWLQDKMAGRVHPFQTVAEALSGILDELDRRNDVVGRAMKELQRILPKTPADTQQPGLIGLVNAAVNLILSQRRVIADQGERTIRRSAEERDNDTKARAFERIRKALRMDDGHHDPEGVVCAVIDLRTSQQRARRGVLHVFDASKLNEDSTRTLGRINEIVTHGAIIQPDELCKRVATLKVSDKQVQAIRTMVKIELGTVTEYRDGVPVSEPDTMELVTKLCASHNHAKRDNLGLNKSRRQTIDALAPLTQGRADCKDNSASAMAECAAREITSLHKRLAELSSSAPGERRFHGVAFTEGFAGGVVASFHSDFRGKFTVNAPGDRLVEVRPCSSDVVVEIKCR